MRGRNRGFALCALLMSACSARVTGGLDEGDANQVVAALEREGIAAEKSAEGGSGDARFSVEVARSELGAALRVLDDSSLPRSVDPGIAETYAEPSLVPSAQEERARYHAALAGELASTLERIDGVVDARVHVGIPETRELALDARPDAARASVLLKVRRGAHVDAGLVRSVVAGAIDGLSAEAVSVATVPSGPVAGAATRLAAVGPFRVAAGSRVPLAATLVTSILLHIATATVLILLVRRGVRRDESADLAG